MSIIYSSLRFSIFPFIASSKRALYTYISWLSALMYLAFSYSNSDPLWWRSATTYSPGELSLWPLFETLFIHSSWQRSKVGTPHQIEVRLQQSACNKWYYTWAPGGCRNRGCLLCCARLYAVRGQSLCWDLDESPPFIVSRQCSVVG